MKVNTISNNITFKENLLSRNMSSSVAILSLQNPNAKTNFERDIRIDHRANDINSDFITSTGYKLYKTFKILLGNDSRPVNSNKTNFNAMA